MIESKPYLGPARLRSEISNYFPCCAVVWARGGTRKTWTGMLPGRCFTTHSRRKKFEMTQRKPDFDNLSDRPGHVIRRMHQIHVSLFLEECADYNLTPVQFGVLTVLLDGKVRDQVTIAKMIGVDRNTAADVIRRLARRDLLERPDNLADKRTKLAKITATGKHLVEQVQPGMINAQERLISPLNNDEYQRFMELSQKLISANDHSSRAPWTPSIGDSSK